MFERSIGRVTVKVEAFDLGHHIVVKRGDHVLFIYVNVGSIEAETRALALCEIFEAEIRSLLRSPGRGAPDFK